MRFLVGRSEWRAIWVAGAVLIGALAGCGDGDVVAKVGRTKVRRVDLEAFQGGKGRTADAKSALDTLVERALVAEAGRRAGIGDDPAVRARLSAAEREIVAQAFLDRELARAGREDELRKRYAEQKESLARKQVHVQHIAVHAAQGDPAARGAAQSKVSRAYSRLVSGEPFEKVAREMSEDSVTGPKGGDLGPLREGQVDPGFFAQVAALKNGELTKPFESPFGFHIARAVEDPQQVTPPFEEVKGLLAADARREAQEKLLGRLRGEIAVKTYPERLGASTQAVAKARSDQESR